MSEIISGAISGLTETTVIITCTSLVKPSGNNGRIGRSIKRAIKVSSSEGRPSRLKKSYLESYLQRKYALDN